MKTTILTAAGLLASLAILPAATVQHYWDFEGGYADKAGDADGTAGVNVSTGTGHDGNTAAVIPGNQAGGFNSASYVDIDQTQTWSPGTGAFSMSYWINIADDGGTLARGIFDLGGNGGDGPQSLYIGSSGNLAFRIDGTTGGQAALVPMAEDGAWHLVVANYAPGSGIELHLDGFGIDATTTITDFGSITLDPDQYLGAFNVDGTNPDRGLNGSLDDVAIYDGTLTETQITGLFNKTITPAQIPEPSSGLLGLLGALVLLRRRR